MVEVFLALALTTASPDAQKAAALAAYKQLGYEQQTRMIVNKYVDKPYATGLQYTYQVIQIIQKKEITYGWEF